MGRIRGGYYLAAAPPPGQDGLGHGQQLGPQPLRLDHAHQVVGVQEINSPALPAAADRRAFRSKFKGKSALPVRMASGGAETLRYGAGGRRLQVVGAGWEAGRMSDLSHSYNLPWT